MRIIERIEDLISRTLVDRGEAQHGAYQQRRLDRGQLGVCQVEPGQVRQYQRCGGERAG